MEADFRSERVIIINSVSIDICNLFFPKLPGPKLNQQLKNFVFELISFIESICFSFYFLVMSFDF